MNKINLYTGGGASLSPQNGEGRTLSSYVRLVADESKGITDGNTITTSIDTRNPEAWTDCDAPPEPTPEPTPDENELLDIITEGTT